jgi:CIC family chloride channel protein
MVGMGALAVAIIGGPFTMSFLVLETTNDFGLTAATLTASLVASVLVRETFGYSFSTWRLHLRGETIRSASDVGWLRSLTAASLMRTDTPVIDDEASIADCRRSFPLGSCSVILVVDDAGNYRGLVPLLELFSTEHDLAAFDTAASELATCADTFLLPSMNIKEAMAHFDQTGTEILAVLESTSGRRIVGVLSEADTNRRYVQELGRAARGVLDLN